MEKWIEKKLAENMLAEKSWLRIIKDAFKREESAAVRLTYHITWGVICLALLAIIGLMFFTRVEIEGSCNSGKIGLQYERSPIEWQVQMKGYGPDSQLYLQLMPQNKTQLESFKVNGIDGMQCSGKIKAPLLLFLRAIGN